METRYDGPDKRIWVGGQQLPPHMGLLFKRPEPPIELRSLKILPVIHEASPEAWFTKKDNWGNFWPTERVPLELYITMRWDKGFGVIWSMWFLGSIGQGEFKVKVPAGYTGGLQVPASTSKEV